MDELLPADEIVAPVVLNTSHARAMLAKRFAAPEWALMEEVAPSTGGGTRYADAVAVNLWQSRGHAIYGFEIKTSRGDWLRELKAPHKTEESVYRYCDRWFVVAPKGVVLDGELPPTWGLLEVRESGLLAKVEAPKLEPIPVGRAFFASLMRRSFECIDAIAARKNRAAIDTARASMEASIRSEVERRTKQHREIVANLEKLKTETGIDISHWSGPPIAMIKLAQRLDALNGYGQGPLQALTDLANQLERATTTVREAIQAIPTTEAAP